MSLKILINPVDYRSLKVLLTLELLEKTKDVTVERQMPGSANPSAIPLPVLEVDIKKIISQENAICRYFINTDEASILSDINKWLEWEKEFLQPALVPIINHVWGGPAADSKAVNTVKFLLSQLNNSLQEKSFLVSLELTIADIVVWVSLFPLTGKDEMSHTYFEEYPHITKWHKRLAEHQIFVQVISAETKTKGVEVYKDSFIRKTTTHSTSSRKEPSIVSLRGFPEHNPAAVDDDGDNTDDAGEVTSAEILKAYEVWLTGRESVPQPKPTADKILPVPGEKNVLITSALPYVNNVPHLGNIIGCVLSADVFARYCRLRNYNILLVCGTDEYGTATETKALEEGVTPQEICDKYHKLHAEIYEWFNISFDYFGRTTTQLQTEIAQDIFWRLYRGGYLVDDSMEQLLCPKCNRFLADRFVEGICPFCAYDDARGDQCDKCGKLINAVELKSPRCKVCGTEPEKKSSDHLFLDLPKLEEKLWSWFEETSNTGVWSQSAKFITRSWLKDGLKQRCITRDLKWGTPVPLEGYTDKVFYVWFDAPIGYLSITANYTDQWEKWWKNPKDVKLYHFMAKDNVPFHAVIFPACQMGADNNYTLVSNILSTEYLNYEDGKFSKSRGVGVFGNNAKETEIPADIWRFYLLYIRPETQDSYFSWSDLMLKNNSELLNNLGNFINRALMFVSNSFGGIIPDMDFSQEDKIFLAQVNRELHTYLNLLENVRLRDAIRHILNISRLGNQHIQSQKPWVLVKGSDTDRARAGTIVGLAANVSCLLSIMLQPYMPTVSRTIQDQLNVPESINVLPENLVCYLPVGHHIGKPAPLFQKLESVKIEKFRKMFAGTQNSNASSATPVNNLDHLDAKVSSEKIVKDPKIIEELTLQVNSQGIIVRELKTNKADKAKIDEEVAKLLALKLQLANAIGEDVTKDSGSKSKSKKKTKK